MSNRKNYNDIFRQRLQDEADKYKSNQAFADELGVSRQTLGFWLQRDEKKRRTPDMDYLIQISDALNMSIDYLVGKSLSNSLDADVQSVVRYTGLAEETIDALGTKYDGLGATFMNGFVASGYYDSFMLDMCKALNLATSKQDNYAPIAGYSKPRFGHGNVDDLDLSITKMDFLKLYADELGRNIGEYFKEILIDIADDVQVADIESMKKQIEELKATLRKDEVDKEV